MKFPSVNRPVKMLCRAMVLSFMVLFLIETARANEPDSAYIFTYSTLKNQGKNGLHVAWSIDQKNWHAIGPEHRFLGSDYGSWGGEKRMYDPYVFQDGKGTWHCIWTLNNRDGVFAQASSNDLVNWKPQRYPTVLDAGNCMRLEAKNLTNGDIQVSWLSINNGDSAIYTTTTSDFITCTATKSGTSADRINDRKAIKIKGQEITGTMHKVAWSFIDNLLKAEQLAAYQSQMTNEFFNNDPVHFKDMKPVEATLVADLNDQKPISDDLIGIFFEDINYAADGGLYAELVQNRSFEYDLSDKQGRDASWVNTKSWSLTDSINSSLVIDTTGSIHPNNPHFAMLKTSKVGAGLANEGIDGMPLKAGEKYEFSAFVKNAVKGKTKFLVQLVNENGEVVGDGNVSTSSETWKKVTTVISVQKTADKAHLEILPQQEGIVSLDMVSLFPQNTFKGHKNGLRPDLAQTIADLHPKFVRFPGGCVVHGNGLENIYKWKNTVGPLEERKPQRNIWNYHQSFGLGFYEYFQFCEDINATPIPVIAAGVPCQNSSVGGAGQQGGVPMCDMDAFTQDILDLIEYANGSTKTAWGKKRAEAGHPKPFNLKYIGIGNEDLISEVLKERFALINKAIQEKYPDIVVIGTVGPFYKGSDYDEGWRFATELGLEMVDEHYYENPGWFINNQDYYDKYSREKAKVYLGEYASRGNKLYNALAEAIYLTAIERNADVVHMASYAPLLAKNGHTQWGTDLIFFNNTDIKPTPSYHVQKMFGQNSGNQYISNYVDVKHWNSAVQKRIGASVVEDSQTGDVIVKLVNVLPVEAKTEVQLNGLNNMQNTATQITLTGNKDDRRAEPNEVNIEVGDTFQVTLPPYSFVLVRLKSNN